MRAKRIQSSVRSMFVVDLMIRMCMIVHMARSMVTDLQPTKARVIADLHAAFGEVKCIGSERLVRLGISMTQLHVLNLLDRHGEMAMSRLADMLDVSMSAAAVRRSSIRASRSARSGPRSTRLRSRPAGSCGPRSASARRGTRSPRK